MIDIEHTRAWIAERLHVDIERVHVEMLDASIVHIHVEGTPTNFLRSVVDEWLTDTQPSARLMMRAYATRPLNDGRASRSECATVVGPERGR